MQLIITEKPKVAEKMAYALAEGKVEKKHGRGQVSYYLLKRGKEEIAVTPAVGHIYSLHQMSKGRDYPVFDIEWKPAFEVEKEADYTRGYIETIEMLGKKADEVVVACDYDIEGSLIGYNALRFACDRQDGKRMKFSALTPKDLEEAYEGREALDLQNALAGEARHVLDWYYGINLSRALMGAIKAAGRFQVMSIGRVQGPALKLLADREKAIKAFKPTPYWELTCDIDAVKFKHEKEKFEVKEEAAEAFEASKPKPHIIASISRKPYEQKPNPPFDLTSLQVEAYRHFKFQPTATLEMAQTLYEASMISYPRTSSQKLPAKLGLAKIIGALGEQAEYSALSKQLVEKKLFVPFEGKKDDPAHPAIHPTGQKGEIGERESKLYDLIVKRFLSCFAPNAKRESQMVVAKCNTQNYKSGGARTLEAGWLKFYEPYGKFEEVTLPDWKEGQAADAKEFRMDEKKTQPPKRFTPASVISELEDQDLGTKATRAVVVDTLFKRGYLKGSSSIEVTQFGLSVVDVMGKYSPEILDAELTRKIEKEMEAIQENHIHKDAVIEDGKKLIEQITSHFKTRERAIGDELIGAIAGAREEASRVGDCPKCGDGSLRIIKSKFNSQFIGCSNYPKCNNTYPLPRGVKVETMDGSCVECGMPQVRITPFKSHPFVMCINFDCATKRPDYKPPAAGAASSSAAGAAGAAGSSGATGGIVPIQFPASATASYHPAERRVQVGDLTFVKKPSPSFAKGTGGGQIGAPEIPSKPAVPTLIAKPSDAPKTAVYSRKAAAEKSADAKPKAKKVAAKKKTTAKK